MRLLDRVLLPVTVEEVEPVGPRMRRIRLAGHALRGLAWEPGQHVRLQVANLLAFRDALRTYSIWDHHPDGRLDLCVLDHETAGPGALWARRARPGTRAAITRPEGRLLLRPDAPYHLFAGDETAAPAFGAMLRALPASATVRGAVAAPFAIPRCAELTPAPPDDLLRAVRGLDLPGHPGAAYVAGEARACQAVRDHLVRERGWPRDAVRVKAFWAPGRRGLD